MVGIGENYLPAFVLAMSANQVACGLASSVPVVLGAVLQLIAPRMLRRLHSYRRWVVCCAALQALSFVPLLAAALIGAMPLAVVFLVISIYWAAGLAGGSAWSDWVGWLVPARRHARYFAWRTRLCQAGTLAGIVAGGLTLQLGAQYHATLLCFAIVFAAAALCRTVAAGWLATQSEPAPPGPAIVLPRLRELLLFFTRGGCGRAFCYLLAVQAAVQISGPYFTPYMLGQLQLSYGRYVALLCASYVAKMAFLPAWGRVAARYGPQRLLWIGGLAIVPCSAVWLVSDSFPYLLSVQVLSGVAWGAYELATLLLTIDAIPSRQRVGLLTAYNLANASALLIGSLLGGAILWGLGKNREAYLLLFALSSAARAISLVALAPTPGWARRSLGAMFRRSTPPVLDGEAGPLLPAPALTGPHWTRRAPGLPAGRRDESAAPRPPDLFTPV